MSFVSLEQVISDRPLCVTPETSLIEVLKQMSQNWASSCKLASSVASDENKIAQDDSGCALVIADSQLLGILTARDIVKLIAAGSTITEITAAEVMTQSVITLTATGSEDIFTALSLMRWHHIRHLPIVNEQNQILGLVTSRSIRQRLRPTDMLGFRRVGEVMSTQVIHASPTASVLSVAQLMASHQVSCVVIVEQGRCGDAGTRKQEEQGSRGAEETNYSLVPIGIITERDIIQLQRLELHLESLTAQTVMSTPLFCVRPEDSLWAVHQQMQQYQVRRVVVTGKENQLQGIVTQSSLLKVLDPTEMYEVLEHLQHQVQHLETEKVKLWQTRTNEIQKQHEREQLVTEISQHIRQSLDLQEVLNSTVTEMRQFLQTDRVLVFQFASDMSGTIVAESVAAGLTVALGSKIEDTCFQDGAGAEEYLQGKKHAMANIYEAGLTDCHIELLEQFEVKANLVVPILVAERLWGLLIAHQCRDFRDWQTTELDLLDRLGIQLAIAIHQAELYQQEQIRASQQHAIAQLGQSALVEKDLGKLMDEAVSLIAPILEVEYCKILELLPDEETLLLRAGVGWQEGLLGQATVRAGPNSQAGYTLLNWKPVMVEDLRSETRFSNSPLLHDHQIVSGMSVIIHGKERPFGVLGVHTTQRRSFSSDDLNFLQAIANVLANGIEHQQAKAELRESEARFRTVADCAPVLIWMSDTEGQFTFFNQPWLEFTGRTLQQEYGYGWAESFHPDDLQHRLDTYRSALAARQPFKMEYRLRRADGEYRWVLDQGVPRFTPLGDFVGYIGSCIDITERREIEQRLRLANDEIEQWANELEVANEEMQVVEEELRQQNEDLRKARQLAQAQQQRYQDLFNFAPDGYLVTDAEGKIEEANLAIAALLRAEPAALIGKPLSVFIPLQERPAFQTRFSQLTAGEEQQSTWELNLQPDEGDPVPAAITVAIRRSAQAPRGSQGEGAMSESYSDIRDPHAQSAFCDPLPEKGKDGSLQNHQQPLVGFRWLIRDISDRKQAEKALRQSEERFRVLVTSAPVGIFQTNLQGDCLFVNPRWQEMTGLSAAEAMGTSWIDALHPDDREQVSAEWYDAVQAGREFKLEHRFRTPQGKVTWVSGNAIALPDATGAIAGYLGTVTDITDRKQAEQKIREQATLLDVTTDAIIVRDLENKVLFWSKGAERIYGWQAAEVIGQNVNIILNREISAEIEAAWENAIAQGEWQGELKKYTKSGKELILESRWSLVRDEAGNPESILSVDTDITDKKQLEEQFLHTQRLESIGVLAGGIAHDLNNILTPILMSAQILPLILPEVDERSQTLLELLDSNAKRGAALVKQVLSFARGIETENKPLQLGHLLWDLKNFAQHTFPKSIEVQSKLPKDLWIVRGDVTQLHQVLMNLCVNARDAMPNGGILSISAQNLWLDENYARTNIEAKVGAYVLVAVSDTGIGIPPEIIDRIFEPFFTTKEVGQGTGLGLSTVAGIVKNHGGFIKVYSEPGSGTQFKIYLPAVETAPEDVAESQSSPHGQGELILVVDDEAPIREVTKTALEAHNYRVITASDGIEAIAVYVQHQPEIDLVLMDLMMPLMDGVMALRTLQKINPQVKAIAVSGLAASERLAAAKNLGIKTFLFKPYTAEELLHTLDKILANYTNVSSG